MLHQSAWFRTNKHLKNTHKVILFLIVGVAKIYKINLLHNLLGNKGFGFLIRQLSRIVVFDFQMPDPTGRCKFEISSNDKYWLKAFLIENNYEIEVLEFLMQADFEFNFLDLGSNIGYWAVMANSLKNCKRIALIEANLNLIPKIQKNLKINSVSAIVINGAIVSSNAPNIMFHIPVDAAQHATSSVKKINKSKQISVPAYSFDSLVQRNLEGNSILIVKMDLEGIEYEILSSSTYLTNPHVIVIYEDHGSDKSHKATKFLLARGLHNVYLLIPNKSPIKISSPEELNALKKDFTKGYNFVSIHKLSSALNSS